MTLIQFAFLAFIFFAAFGLVAFAISRLIPSVQLNRLRKLDKPTPPGISRNPAQHWIERAARITAPLGKLSSPGDEENASSIRNHFLHAGIRHSSAPMLYFGGKTTLAISLPALAYMGMALGIGTLASNKQLLILLAVASAGYYLPNLILWRLVFVRQREIFENFPDALDLMTVCVEAGLGIDSALNRVATDIAHKSRTLSDELRMVGLELRAGSDRPRALRNLAARTGVEELQTWVTMMIQADRFGTSIAATLRVHSDMLRTKRRQRAEETAAKMALKMLFPLIFFIFPSLMLVLLGPALLQIYRILLPTMVGGQ